MTYAKSASRSVAALTILALAATFTLAPTFVPGDTTYAAAHAKGGKDKASKAKGKSDKASGSRSGGSLKASLKSLFGKDKKKARKTTRASTKSRKPATEMAETDLLKPNQKGRWNAANANQKALDAHIRNGNFNGTVGSLALLQLAGLAASGEELTPEQQAALDDLIGDVSSESTDEELADLLNGDGSDDTLPQYEVTDGVATCVANCDGVDDADANQQIADYVDEAASEAEQAALDDLLAQAEQNILDKSNKSTDGIEDQLLNELAAALGFERAVEDPEVDPELDPELLPEDDLEPELETASAD